MEPQRDELSRGARSPAPTQSPLVLVLMGAGLNVIALVLGLIPLIGIVALPLALGGGGMAGAALVRNHRSSREGGSGEAALACVLLGSVVLCMSLLNVMVAISSVMMGLMMGLMALMLGAS